MFLHDSVVFFILGPKIEKCKQFNFLSAVDPEINEKRKQIYIFSDFDPKMPEMGPMGKMSARRLQKITEIVGRSLTNEFLEFIPRIPGIPWGCT